MEAREARAAADVVVVVDVEVHARVRRRKDARLATLVRRIQRGNAVMQILDVNCAMVGSVVDRRDRDVLCNLPIAGGELQCRTRETQRRRDLQRCGHVIDCNVHIVGRCAAQYYRILRRFTLLHVNGAACQHDAGDFIVQYYN